MHFEKRFKRILNKMIPKDNDGYTEVKYSNSIYVHVWSHPNGEGSFEIEVIVPHDSIDDDIIENTGREFQFEEIPESDSFYEEIDEYIEDITGESYEFTFSLVEVVDDGTWEKDANVYSTSELVDST